MSRRPKIKGYPSRTALRTPSGAAAQRKKPTAAGTWPSYLGERTNWLCGLLLVAVTIAAYQHAWHAGYIWDDDIYVTANPLLTAPDGLRRIWFSLDSPSQYFPLVYTTFRFEYALWGLNPAGYHWVNILLHAVNALLVWRLLHALRVPGAWLAAALFAFHPVQVESVAWITERKNVLMGCFFLLALLGWTRFLKGNSKGRWKFYVAALICAALALFSKTTACTIPAALLLILWLKRKPVTLARLAQIAPFVLMGIAMGLVSIWWERNHQGTQGPFFSVGLPERILVASRAIWFYLWKLFWPVGLAFSYPRWPISAANPVDYIWILMLLAAAALIGFLRRFTGRALEVATLFFVATLSPTLGLIMLYTFRYSWVADHYQYLACIGPFALVAAGLKTAWDDRAKATRHAITLGCATLLFSLVLLTWKQGAIYAGEETLWRATIATNPRSWMAQNNLAIQLVKTGRVGEGISHYTKALEIYPDYPEAHCNLGDALLRLGRLEEARTEYERALSLYPRFAVAQTNLGEVLLRMGKPDEGIAHLKEAIAMAPKLSAPERGLGEALLHSGRAAGAVDPLRKAAALDPRSSGIRDDLVSAYLQSGDTAQAIEQLDRSLETNPGDGAAQSRLGIILANQGDTPQALSHLEKAAQLEPVRAEAQYNLANAFAQVGRKEEAIARYREALRLRPGYAAAHNNLANTLAQTGRLDEALNEYNRALELKPNNKAARKNLATVLRRLGRADEAQRQLEQAGEINPVPRESPPER